VKVVTAIAHLLENDNNMQNRMNGLNQFLAIGALIPSDAFKPREHDYKDASAAKKTLEHHAKRKNGKQSQSEDPDSNSTTEPEQPAADSAETPEAVATALEEVEKV